MVAAGNAAELMSAMKRILTEESLQKSLRQKGIKRAEQFIWETAARATINVYENLVTKRR
jgi:glycosyltransferase involved in cell wall biosynthesis